MLVSRNFSGEWPCRRSVLNYSKRLPVFCFVFFSTQPFSFLEQKSFSLLCLGTVLLWLHLTILKLTLTAMRCLMCVTWGDLGGGLSWVKGHCLTLVPPNGMLLCPIVGRQHTSPAAPTTSTAALAQEGMCREGTICLSVVPRPACLARGRMVCPERTDSHCTHSDRHTDGQRC